MCNQTGDLGNCSGEEVLQIGEFGVEWRPALCERQPGQKNDDKENAGQAGYID